MNIAKNLQYLRKRDKITQEDLAEKLNVSRQSVSKWETGEAYPETEKLLTICELFDVSLDGLMRSDLSEQSDTTINNIESSEPKTETEGDEAELTDHKIYAEHINKFSIGMAIGAMLIMLGIAVCVALCGYSFLLSGVAEEVTSVMSGVAVILFTAGAIYLFVYFGHGHDSFKRAHPVIAEPTDKNHKGFAAKIASLVSGIFIDVVYLIVMTTLIETKIIPTKNTDTAVCFVTAAFLAALALIIGGLVFMGIRHSKYNVEEYNRQTQRELHPTQGDKIARAICGGIMMTATAIFLIIGFVGGYWHPGWIIFPFGGISCGIINAIFKFKEK